MSSLPITLDLINSLLPDFSDDGADVNLPDWPIICAVCGQVMVGGPTFRQYVEEAFRQYLETALWSSHDWSAVDDVEVHNPIPLDENYSVSDLDVDTQEELLADVVGFIGANWSDVRDLDPELVGHDFWLTRNGHGAGFWDRGLGDRGDRLTDASKIYGTVDIYVGDDGDLYV